MSHPIGTMRPAVSDEEMLVRLAWRLREEASECERSLDSDAQSVELASITPPTRLHSMADTCAGLAESLGQHEAALLFGASASHFDEGDAHLKTHVTYIGLVDEHPNDQHFADIHDNQRTFAARALTAGKKMAHRGLGKLIETWPNTYVRDET